MTVIELNDAKIIYLTNSLGEETGNKIAKEETIDWYVRTKLDSVWLQYLVELEGIEGILTVQEFSDPSNDTSEDKKENHTEKWKHSSANEIWEHLADIATHFRSVVEFEVLIGKETGFLGMHELCIFFPKNTAKEAIANAFKQLEEIKTFY